MSTCTDELAERSRLAPLADLFRRHWRRVGVTYALYNVENLLRVAQPSVLGLAINDLLAGRYRGLGFLVAQHLGWLGVATARQAYDTRAFTAIYTATAARLVAEQRGAGVEVSVVAARSALARELVDFFEHDLKGVFSAVYGVIGALAMLLVYDPAVAGLCLLLLGPLVVLSRRLGRRSLALNAALNAQIEREVAVIAGDDPDAVVDHYDRVARSRIQLSDLEAGNFFQMEVCYLALVVVALAQYCVRSGVAAGDIYAVFSYIFMFGCGLDCVPMVVGQLARLRDIGGRVGAVGPADDPAPGAPSPAP